MLEPKQTDTYSVQRLILEKKSKKRWNIEKIIPKLLFLTAVISVFITIGIILTLIFETFIFFDKVSIVEFLTGQKWLPFASTPSYGVMPLVVGTLKVTVIAALVAVPVGLATAIFLSEYASEKTRRIIKPILEVLAGIPTIVYGFFALTFVTPVLRDIFPSLDMFNALSPGIVVGIMIMPMIASLSEDALVSVPKSIREGAYALGATKLETTIKVVLPAAMSGIVASIVLALSRAIGETMIVSVAGGSTPSMSMDVTSSIQTMTAYIVQVSTGDAGYGTTIYYSIYAVGMTLFVFTLIMNLLAQFISRKFREEY
ncbi:MULTISPECIES: phosphate ABC transporter permease subunit PstC [Bacillaceae]|uniref:phosphate ABC transporter permease subunit PstC n=1 Tax=Bacillaceae TaxID=186817 RepID=UPI000BFA4AC2|nr:MULTISPECIES: phosphate ABC transporter permease subunit PstC [Bacillaceae]MBD8135058.1 phosphate ABC transporter permease subunit PstC [Bacillus sp. CFBP 13597]MDM5359731.1 phosphate ABC transporter permease subunit PstC [Peribacillus sp. ACCC06369]PEZ83433.1 phosphate ABC transporter permease subunit PstC [Bacillus sp. AFS017274]